MSYGIFESSTRVDRDKRLKSVYSSDSIKATIAMLTKIAKCNGAVSIDEAQFIKKVIDNTISIAKRGGAEEREAKNLRRELVDTYKSVKNSNRSIDHYAHHFTKHSYLQRVNILQELISMAKVEYLSNQKIEMLYSVGEVFGFEYSKIESYIGVEEESSSLDIDRAYSILNSKDGDNIAIIKKRYRKLVKEYHPDMIYSKNIDRSFEILAKEKMQELNDAYELIKSIEQEHNN
jgi:DnaJ like chaperone protein